MKKILSATTILVGVALATAANAGGEPPAPKATSKAAGSGNAAYSSSAPAAASSAEVGSLADAFKQGKAYIAARYRYEHADDTSANKEADASTIRTNLGFDTAKFHGLSGKIEFQDVTVVGEEDFNNGTASGVSGYVTVADVEGTELNQGYISYEGVKDTLVRGGRAVVNIDNQRFVGSSDWRQNDRSLDLFGIMNKSLPDTQLDYWYVYNVNQPSTANLNTDTHVIHAAYSGLPNKIGTIALFGYLLDHEHGANSALSSATYGARFNGSQNLGNNGLSALYDLSYAMQSDHGDNTTSYDANYYNIEPGLAYSTNSGVFTVKAGYEVLGADDATGTATAFQTPLATHHRWNGWADQFLTTPAGGLQDLYGVISYKIGGIGNEYVYGTTFTVAYHDFQSDESTAGITDNIGSEWDAEIVQTFKGNYTAGVKYANYEDEAVNAATTLDVEKIMVTLGVKFSQ